MLTITIMKDALKRHGWMMPHDVYDYCVENGIEVKEPKHSNGHYESFVIKMTQIKYNGFKQRFPFISSLALNNK